MIRTAINLWRLEPSGDGLVRRQFVIVERFAIMSSEVGNGVQRPPRFVVKTVRACAAAYLGLCLFVMVRERHACADTRICARTVAASYCFVAGRCMYVGVARRP